MQTEFVVNTCVTVPISIIDTFVSYVVVEKKYYLICFPRELSQTLLFCEFLIIFI